MRSLSTHQNLTDQELLVGAYELGLRALHQQADRDAIAENITLIYAVDVDVLKAFASPEDNLEYASITGLLPYGLQQTSQNNASLRAMAEILVRFVFREPAQKSYPLILLPALKDEFFEILDIVESEYLNQVNKTFSNVEHASSFLKELISRYLNSNATPEKFIENVGKN